MTPTCHSGIMGAVLKHPSIAPPIWLDMSHSGIKEQYRMASLLGERKEGFA